MVELKRKRAAATTRKAAPAKAKSARATSSRTSGGTAGPTASRDPRVDAYIAKAPEFARPILVHLREVVHAGCPEVTETIKWGMPSFEYQGILAGMAAFKAHCVFGFWKHELLIASDERAKEAMGSFGCLRTLGDLPSRAVLLRYVKQARQLNRDGVKAPRTKTARKEPIAMHPDFARALAQNAAARKALESFSPSHQREYVEWVSDAKKDDTRARRIETAVEWLSEGKRRHWKYENC